MLQEYKVITSFILFCLVVVFLPLKAAAVKESAIVLKVGDAIVTQKELESRVAFVALTSGLEDTPSLRQQIRDQVLKTLRDEKLQVQEANKFKMTVPEEEIQEFIRDIEKRENLAPRTLYKMLKAHNLPESTLKDHVHALLLWQKMIRARFGHSVHVSEKEVKEESNRYKGLKEKGAYYVFEIFLPFDKPSEEAKIRKEITIIYNQIKKGASFSMMAQQFSKSASAAKGGNIGVTIKGELAPEIEKVLQTLAEGETSTPFKVAKGYYIVMKQPISQTLYSLINFILNISDDATQDMVEVKASYVQSLNDRHLTCATLGKVLKSEMADVDLKELALPLSQLHPDLRNLIKNLKVNEIAGPIQMPKAIGGLMMCGKQTQKMEIPSKNEIADTLRSRKLNMLAQRTLRDLRNNTYVEFRL